MSPNPQSARSHFDGGVTSLGGLGLRYPVRNLSEIDKRLDGIFSPGYSENEIGKHIHGVFLQNAEHYLAFCPINQQLIDHWKDLIRAAIGKYLAFDHLVVVDIGSGVGTSVFPMLELVPTARLFATDLSLPLLAQLRNRAHRDGVADRLTLMQMNAEDIVFSDGQADVIMGANILHHAVSPEQILAEIRRVLKPTGVAAFWEGFEGGAQIIASIFDVLLEGNENRLEKLPVGVSDAMHSFIADLIRRRGRSKSLEVLLSLDDKWYFTDHWISDLAASTGFARYEVRSCYHTFNVVWSMVSHELARFGYSAELLPQWAREKVLTIQDRYSDDWLAENLFEAAIVLEA